MNPQVWAFILNVLTSGKKIDPKNELMVDTFVRYVLINVLAILGTLMLYSFGSTLIQSGDIIQGLIDYLLAIMLIVSFVLLRSKVRFIIPVLITFIAFMFFCSFLVIHGSADGFSLLWVYIFPMLAIFVLELQLGMVLSLALLTIIAAALFMPGITTFDYNAAAGTRIVAVYVIILAVSIVYEQVRTTKEKWSKKLVTAMQAERDGITDNLKAGLFLMDKTYQILPLYSKVLEEIFSRTDLLGSNFVDLLTDSISLNEQDILKDYFVMVVNRSFDQKMLEDINPLNEFTYIQAGSKQQKILRCAFAAMNRGDDETIILATIQDITKERILQKQLLEEDAKRQEEMRSLFEVIQVEPKVLGDFLEDSEYEFDHINDILKDDALDAQAAMVAVYQSIHAIKANAVILGLDSFSNKLHALESQIKVLRDKASISFEDTLHITVEIEKIMREKDKFRTTVNRIHSFKLGENVQTQNEYVLVESLKKTASKVAADTGKQVQLLIDGIDHEALDKGPRRVIKEVLVQLVRNAVFHGIEEQEIRKASGKEETGLLRLSIKMIGKKVYLRVSDDGHGLNFNLIREKAEKQHLFPDTVKLTKQRLLQAIFMPGFSTSATENMHAGRGIGLNLVHGRIRELKGEIKIQSQAGKGTVFNVYIPVQEVPHSVGDAG
jgi:two-component system chemotaxis sensor kinase CheA